MPSDPTILAFDTSAAHCAAALLSAGKVVGATTVPMARGQAEALMPLLDETRLAAPAEWSDLDAIAVGIGPGNFTGIRISVSAARGLSLALGIPAIGVSMFEVLASDVADNAVLACLPAPRDMAYCQLLASGIPATPARLVDPSNPLADLAPAAETRVVGHKADVMGVALGLLATPTEVTDIAERIARIAEARIRAGIAVDDRPAPLYVRPADAAPPADPPPVILP